jgi:hypothetical protein
MVGLPVSDKLILLQYAIEKYDSENLLKEKLKNILAVKEIESAIDTLIGTQKVRRIGTDVLQNNISHAGELSELPKYLQGIFESI